MIRISIRNILSKALLIFAFTIILPAVAKSQICGVQCLGFPAEQNTYFSMNNIPNAGVGQTFEACLSGNITTVDIKMDATNTYSGVINLWIGAEPGDGNQIAGGPVYQTFNVLNTDLDGAYNIVLNIPFPVINGNQYRIAFAPAAAGAARFDINASGQAPNIDCYPDGTMTGSSGQYFNPSADPNILFADLNYRVTIEFVEIVPTMSQWSLIILALILMILASLAVRSKLVPES